MRGKVTTLNRTRRRGFRWVPGASVCALVATLALLTGCGDAAADISREEPVAAIPVETLQLVPQTFDEHYQAPGLVEAEESATISSEIAGRVLHTAREIGDLVSRGQLLAQLDARTQEAQVQRLEAELERARTELVWAERELERQRRLYEDEIAAERGRDEAQRQVDTAQRDVVAREANLEVARVELERTRILSPLAGSVSRRHVTRGEYVTPGTPLYDLVATRIIKFVFSVAERDVVSLVPGQEVDVSIDARPEYAYRGRVAAISPAGSNATRTYRVELRIQNPPEAALLPGMAGTARVVRARHDEVLLVPETALLREGARSFLYLTDGQTARRAEVQILSQISNLAVLSSQLLEAPASHAELASGPHLGSAATSGPLQAVIVGQSALTDGASVRVLRRHDVPPSTTFD